MIIGHSRTNNNTLVTSPNSCNTTFTAKQEVSLRIPTYSILILTSITEQKLISHKDKLIEFSFLMFTNHTQLNLQNVKSALVFTILFLLINEEKWQLMHAHRKLLTEISALRWAIVLPIRNVRDRVYDLNQIYRAFSARIHKDYQTRLCKRTAIFDSIPVVNP